MADASAFGQRMMALPPGPSYWHLRAEKGAPLIRVKVEGTVVTECRPRTQLIGEAWPRLRTRYWLAQRVLPR